MTLPLQRIFSMNSCLTARSCIVSRLLPVRRFQSLRCQFGSVFLYSSWKEDTCRKAIRLKLRKPVDKNSNAVFPVTAVSFSRSFFTDVDSQKDSLGCLVQESHSSHRKGVSRKINSLVVSSSSILNCPSTLKPGKFSSKVVDSSVQQNSEVEVNGTIDEAVVTPESTVDNSSLDGKKKRKSSRSKKTKSSSDGEENVSKGTSDQNKHTNKKSNAKIASQLPEVVPRGDSLNNNVKKKKSTAASKKQPENDAPHGKDAKQSLVVAMQSKNQKEIESEDGPQIHQPMEKLEASKSKKSSKKSSVKSSQRKPIQTGKLCSVVSLVPSENGNSQHLGSLYPPLGKTVVIVESITKAKTIQNYLGDTFQVLPSYGHVRNLAARSGSVRPEDDFSMVWEVPSTAWTHLTCIKVALNGAVNLILATDPDREGEAIAWHIAEMLHQQGSLHEGTRVARVAFHEITESAIKSALQAPRDISMNLVNAYLARSALDYLIGFNVSPILWRKLPGCQSAGRVQSAALALVCDREREIEQFKAEEYWTVEAQSSSIEMPSLSKATCLWARLTHFNLKKLEKFSITSQEEADNIVQKVSASTFMVEGVNFSKMHKNPLPPYITSTLQQDAANKLSFSAAYTMKLAQKLYEGVKLLNDEATGLITYIRTDSFHISDGAAKSILEFVSERYGKGSAPTCIRKFLKKVKNAQEAHEAIRPTDIHRLPSSLCSVLDEDSLKLYTLIWCRTMACQMEPAIYLKVQADFLDPEKSIRLRSTDSKIEFLGSQAVYKDEESSALSQDEGHDVDGEDAFHLLSILKSGEQVTFAKVEPKQHFTEPPPRYSEGTLVRKLEELGIGRPSTYATILKILQERNYVTVKSQRVFPEFRGRMVSAFLSHYFSEVTEYSFTSGMENELDNVSAGITEWKSVLNNYWTRFSKYCNHVNKVDIRQVEQMLGETFKDQLFSSLFIKDGTCPSCQMGSLIFKVSRHGSGYFIGCDQHPKCSYIAKTVIGDDDDDVVDKPDMCFQPKLIGLHPTSNEKILLKNGPYGFYIQLGEDRKGYSPKRASLAQVKDVESIGLDDALKLLQYPKTLGNHPEDKKPIILKISKYGFSVRHRRTCAPVPKVNSGDQEREDIEIEFLCFVLYF
ncbi:unnamed protein product [Victoria cruziana]